MFLQDDRRISLTDDPEIREYAAQNGITLADRPEGEYIALYRSHDIFLSILEVNTVLDHEEWKHPYAVQYCIYDIYVCNIENLFTAYTASDREFAEDLIEDAERSMGVDVIAAVNGDYMGNTNHCLVCERNGVFSGGLSGSRATSASFYRSVSQAGEGLKQAKKGGKSLPFCFL